MLKNEKYTLRQKAAALREAEAKHHALMHFLHQRMYSEKTYENFIFELRTANPTLLQTLNEEFDDEMKKGTMDWQKYLK